MGGSIEQWLKQNKEPTPQHQTGEISGWLGRSDPSQRVKAAASVADPVKANEAARVKFLQEKTGLDPNLIRRNPDEVERRAMAAGMDSSTFADQFPHTAKWLGEQPENVEVAHDDFSRLGAIEKTVKSLHRGFDIGREEQEMGDINYRQMVNGSMTDAEKKRLDFLEKDIRRDPSGIGFLDNLVFKTSKMFGQMGATVPAIGAGAATGALAVGTAAALMPAAVLGAPVVGAGILAGGLGGLAISMFRSSAGQTYHDLKSIKDENGVGIDENTAQLVALSVGSVTGGLMAVGGDVLATPYKRAGQLLFKKAAEDALKRPTMQLALREMGVSYAKAAASGTALMTLQEMSSIAGEEIAKIASKGDFETVLNSPRAREAAVKQIAQAVKEGGEAMALAAVPGALLHGAAIGWKARVAERNANYFKALGEGVDGSETFKRLPPAIQRMVEAQTRNGPMQNVYLPAEFWNSYWQQRGEDPGDMAERVVGSRSQWQEASDTGGDVQIPTSRYATTLAPSEHNTAISKQLRRSPLEMSAAEAGDALKEEAKKSEGSPVDENVRKAREESADKVAAEVNKQLLEAKVDPTQAVDYSNIYKAIFKTLSEKTGKTPEELFEKYGLNIKRFESLQESDIPDVGGDAYEQLKKGIKYELFPNLLPGLNPDDAQDYLDFVADWGIDHMADEDIRDMIKVYITKNTRPGEGKIRATIVNEDTKTPLGHMDLDSLEDLQRHIPKAFRATEFYQEPRYFKTTITNREGNPEEQRAIVTRNTRRDLEPLMLTGEETPQDMEELRNAKWRITYLSKKSGFWEPVGHARAATMEEAHEALRSNGRWEEVEGEFFQAKDNSIARDNFDRRLLKTYHENFAKEGFLPDVDGKYYSDSVLKEMRDAGILGIDITGYKALRDRAILGPPPSTPLPEGFFSQAERLVEAKMPNRASIADIRNILQDVKKEERKWLGLDELLHDMARHMDGLVFEDEIEHNLIPKEVVLNALRANRLEIEEKNAEVEVDMHAVNDQVYEGMQEDTTTILETLQEIEIENVAIDHDARGWKVTLPKQNAAPEYARNILEERLENLLLNKLGDPPNVTLAAAREFVDRHLSVVGNRSGDVNFHNEVWQRVHDEMSSREWGQREEAAIADWHDGYDNEDGYVYEQYTLPGGENYREVLFKLPALEGRYTSTHFDTEGPVFAHVRLKDRVDADGSKVLFVEEIQSDWHQEGREKGYVEHENIKAKEEFKAKSDRIAHLSMLGAGLEGGLQGAELEEYARLREEVNRYMAEEDEITSGDKAPDAPFRSTWHEFVFKRVLRMAADGGYDKVAWTTGDQQNERYNLEKVADRVTYGTNDTYWSHEVGEKSGVLRAYKDGRLIYQKADLKPEDLSQHIGREMAEKLLAKKPVITGETTDELRTRILDRFKELGAPMTDRQLGPRGRDTVHGGYWGPLAESDSVLRSLFKLWNGTPAGHRSLEGEELRFGGEGMRGFYDDIMPRFANKFGKKYGAKAEDIKVRTHGDQGGVPDHEDDGNIEKIPGGWGTRVHSLPMTPELKKAALGNEFPLFQKGGADPLGRIRLGDKVSIDLFKHADFSTFVHESGHFFLQILQDFPEMKEDLGVIRSWLGMKTGESFGRGQHETFARAFEQYMAEGRAPVSSLQRVFLRFKTWMMGVYSSLRDLHVELTDEVRGVFDRMLASEAEIRAEQTRQPELFESVKGLGLSEDEAKGYTEAVERARAAASEEMTKKVIADWKREQGRVMAAEREKVHADVSREADENPILQARSFLERGTLPSGAPLPEGTEPFKLNRDDVRAMGHVVPRGMLSNDPEVAIHPDMAADLLGFHSGEQLLHAMSNAEDPDKFIGDRVNAVMRGKKAQIQLLTASEVPREAMRAVHNDKRAELLRKELEILAQQDISKVKGMVRRLSRRIPLLQEIRTQAKAMVEDKTVKTITAHSYLIAEQKAAKAAIEFFNKGDITEAFNQKQRELLNHELFRAAADAQEFVEKAADYMRKFDQKEVRQRLGKAKGTYLEQIDAIRERFDFKDKSGPEIDRKESLHDFLESQQAQGLTPDVPDYLVAEAFKKNFRELKLSELRGVYETAKQIEHFARLKNKLLAADRGRKFGETVAGMTGRIAEEFGEPKDLKPDYAPSFLKRTGRAIKKMDAALTKMEFLFKYLDGHKANGPVWRALFRPLQEAENAENVRFRAAQEALNSIFTSYSGSERVRWWWKKYEVPELKTSLTKPSLLAIALNMGNEYNRDALVTGHERFGWTEAGIQAALKHLDERDWGVVQKVWDHLDSYWPEIAKMETDITGLPPEKVEATPFQTPYGEMRGGYYPIMFDKDVDWRQARVAAEDNTKDLFGGAWSYAVTKHGHTKERVGTGGRPLLLTLSPLINHVANVIHDLSYRRAIIDINRLVEAPDVRGAIEGAVGREMYREIHPWLVAVARERRGEYGNAMEQLIARGRAGATVVHIGWRVTTALVHLPNYSVSFKELGASYGMRGLWDTFKTPQQIRQTYKYVTEQSQFMKDRFEDFDRDIRDQFKRLHLTQAGAGLALHRSYFQLIHGMVMGGSLPTWMGGFRKAMDGKVEGVEAGNALDARDYADSLVREVWSAGSIKDLAAVQRGSESWRAFTMFYTYMSTVYNQLKKTGQEQRLHPDIGKLTAGAMLTWFIPAAMSQIIIGRGPTDPSDPTEWAKWLAKTELEWPFSTVPIIRDIAHPILEGKGDYAPSAAFEMPKAIVKSAQSLQKKFAQDTELTAKEIQNIVDTAGYFLELPTKQLWHTLEAMYDYMTGEKQIESIPNDIFHSLVASAPPPAPARSASRVNLSGIRQAMKERT